MFGLQIEWSMLFNWMISGAIGFVFGILGAMYKHRLDKERDDLAWKRRLEELEKQWEYERRQRELLVEREKLMEGVNGRNIEAIRLTRGAQVLHNQGISYVNVAGNSEEVDTEETDTENESGPSEQS